MSAATGTVSLRGRRILVAEDEYMIASEVAGALAEAGAETLGPVASVAGAQGIVAAGRQGMDAALLDVNLRGEPVWPVVDALRALGVPVVLATGYDAGAIPRAYATLPRCEKPATGRELARVLARALGRALGPSLPPRAGTSGHEPPRS